MDVSSKTNTMYTNHRLAWVRREKASLAARVGGTCCALLHHGTPRESHLCRMTCGFRCDSIKKRMQEQRAVKLALQSFGRFPINKPIRFLFGAGNMHWSADTNVARMAETTRLKGSEVPPRKLRVALGCGKCTECEHHSQPARISTHI